MPSLVSRLLPTLIALRGAKRVLNDPAAVARKVDERMLRPPAYGPPAKLGRSVRIAVDHSLGWPVYRLSPLMGATGRHAVYAHGGAWINEIQPAQWALIAGLVARSGAEVTVPIYPLAPLGTAASVVPVFAEMLAVLSRQHGADRVVAIGDSAGGQIVMSAALLLRDDGAAPVGHCILIAPALDLTMANPQIDAVEPTDPWLARAGVRTAIEYWRGDLAAEHPLVSPLFADLAGLGPITVFSGTRDITNPDTRLFVAKARAAGVEIAYHEGAGLIHVYPILPGPEAAAARAIMVALLR